MTKETLLHVLGAEGLKVASDVVTIPDERDASFIVAGPGETIQVSKVIKLEMRDSALCVETTKGERFWFTFDLLLGVRLTTARTAKDHAAGFTR
jgi:hypothetical protein